MAKATHGNFFEDFEVGQELRHATPRTVTEGDAALYLGLTGSRFLLHCSDVFAAQSGLPRSPLEDLLVFHVVFGKTVPDISLNAVANLGYADGRFHEHVFPGDTLWARSTIIGLKETSSGKTGVVYLRTEGRRGDGSLVLDYVRWVMVRKRHAGAPSPDPVLPDLPKEVTADRLVMPEHLKPVRLDPAITGSPYFFEDYEVGERIDHVDGMAVRDSEHRIATRLYQNTARVHFNDHEEKQGRLGLASSMAGS